MTIPPESMIAVAAPVRDATRRAVLALLATAIAFVLFAWFTKEAPQFRGATPWRDDPYDAVVSFALFFVPLSAGLMLVRVPLCRRSEPLPASRLSGIQRAGNVLVAAVGVTVGADWLAVLGGSAPASWTAATWASVASLALLSVVTAGAVIFQLGAVRRLSRADPPGGGPDWLDDALVLVERAALRLDGRVAVRGVRAASLLVDGRHGVRRHPALFVLALSTTFGLTIAAAEALAEGGGGSPGGTARLIALFATIGAAGMAAFLVVVGRYLRLVRPTVPGTSNTRSDLTIAATIGAASVPLTVAFRDQLTALTGGALSIHTPDDLFILIVAVALGTSSLTALLRSSRSRRRA